MYDFKRRMNLGWELGNRVWIGPKKTNVCLGEEDNKKDRDCGEERVKESKEDIKEKISRKGGV